MWPLTAHESLALAAAGLPRGPIILEQPLASQEKASFLLVPLAALHLLLPRPGSSGSSIYEGKPPGPNRRPPGSGVSQLPLPPPPQATPIETKFSSIYWKHWYTCRRFHVGWWGLQLNIVRAHVPDTVANEGRGALGPSRCPGRRGSLPQGDGWTLGCPPRDPAAEQAEERWWEEQPRCKSQNENSECGRDGMGGFLASRRWSSPSPAQEVPPFFQDFFHLLSPSPRPLSFSPLLLTFFIQYVVVPITVLGTGCT